MRKRSPFFLQVLQARIHNLVGNVGISWEAMASNQTRKLLCSVMGLHVDERSR